MRHLLLTSLFLFTLGLNGQQLQFDHLDVPGGGPRYFIQDDQGFMWFGAWSHLFRYDGYEFKEYQYNPEDSTTFQGGLVDYLYQDSYGDIWIGSMDRGLQRLNPSTGQFTHYVHDPEDSSTISGIDIRIIFEDSNDNLWITTHSAGLNLYDRDNESFKRIWYQGDSKMSFANTVFEAFEYEPNKFWFRHFPGDQIAKFNSETREFEPWISSNAPGNFYKASDGTIWATQQPTGLVTFDKTSEQFIPYSHSNIKIPFFGLMDEDKDGKLYMGFSTGIETGLSVLNPGTSTLTLNSPDFNNPTSIRESFPFRIHFDHSGVLWAAYGSGFQPVVARYNPYQLTQHHISFVPNRTKDNDIFAAAVYIDSLSNIWIGTQGHGLIQYDSKKREVLKQFLFDESNGKNTTKIDILSVFQDQYGIFWIGTINHGLYKLDPISGRWKNYKKGFEENERWWNLGAMMEDSNGNLWICGAGSMLHRLKLDAGNGFNREIIDYEHFPWHADNAEGISSFWVTYAYQDQKANLWFGTTKGLDRYKPETNDFEHYLTTERILSLHEDSSGNLWVGTFSGLFKGYINSQNQKFQFERVYIGSELLGAPFGIVGHDHLGNFWLGSTSKRIVKFHPNTGNYRIYNQHDGVSIDFQNFFQGSNGLIALGGDAGLLVFHPDSIKENQNPPNLVFTDFQVSNQSIDYGDSIAGHPVLDKVINFAKQISLPHGSNFNLEFSALDFVSPDKNQYSYMLEGFDDDWSPPSTTRIASYTNLWEGDYTFRVRGSNNDGVWNMEGASIDITILPPWYRGKIAWIIYGGLLIMALVYARKQIVQREREKARLQMEHLELQKAQEMDPMKTQFFTNISHEFRTPLTLILGPLKQMYEGTFQGDVHAVVGLMIRNSKRLLQLINQLLDFSKLESGAVTLQASVGDLVEFTRTMFATFESTAQNREIRYIFISDVTSLPTYYDRDKLEKVIVNLLSNAFKFTSNHGSIQLTMTRNLQDPQVDKGEGVVEIKIEDNGKGIAPDKLPHIFDRFYQADASSTRQQEGTGIGLALAKELVELHHGTIRATSKKGEGTAFIIHLPLGREHLDDTEVVVRKGYQPIDTTAVEALPQGATIPLEEPNTNGDLPLVLIIDDNQDMRLYIREILAQQYRLAEASNGQKGWEYAREHMPDLVLSDVMMPEMDGHELCQKLKTDEHTSHIPVILLTARAGEKAKLEGLETGADDYITKPFSSEELRARIHNLIELRQKLREQFSSNLSLEPKDIAITSADERFLQRAMDIMEIHRSDSNFSVEAFIKEIGMSNTQLHRKLKALTDQSAGEFIRSYRLKYARQLIEKEYGNMAQVAYECGFNNPSYFAECFKKQFGVLPSEFAKEATKS